MKDETFLGRWSRRKIEARGDRPAAPPAEAVPAADSAPPGRTETTAPRPAEEEPGAALPSLDSLTPHSDYAPFMKGDVDPAIQSRALKKLFSDSALYPMDGLDVYIDDYAKPDPLPAGWLGKLNQMAGLQGEPAPEEERAAPAADPSLPAAAEGPAAAGPSGPAEASESPPPPDPGSMDRGAI